MLYQAQFEQWVPFPLERVFVFFANPENLPRIMPPATDTRIDATRLVAPPARGEIRALPFPLAGLGSEIVTSFRILPFLPLRAQWIARITEFEWNHHFADIQVKGPFRSWRHRHELEAETKQGVTGTTVSDRIEYEIGYAFLDGIAQTLFVRRQTHATFAYRQAALQSLLRQG